MLSKNHYFRHISSCIRQIQIVRMSKRKGPSEENPNGGITDFLMGKFAKFLYIFSVSQDLLQTVTVGVCHTVTDTVCGTQ